MAAAQGYIGRSPADSSTVIARQSFSPTGIQTDFTFAAGYEVGHVDLYLNGARLIEGQDFTATDGSTVGLTTNAINGDVLEVVGFKAFNVSNVSAASENFVVGQDLTVSGTAEVTGAITATGGVVGDITGDATGLSGTPDLTIRNLTGVAATFTGVLSYADVTNVDSVGFATFRSGINVQGAGSTTTTLNVTGVTTMTGDVNLGADFNIPDAITHVGDTNTKIRFPAVDTFTVETGGTEAIRVDSSQRLLVNTATTRTNYDNGSVSSNLLHVERTAASGNAGISICANAATAADAGAILYMGRTKATSNGATTVVADDDLIARISFQGADGSELVEAASIRVDVDGTPGANDMPGRIEFHTTSDGAAGATERLRITSDGSLGINEATPDSKLDIVYHTSENSATANLIHLRADPSGSYASRGLFVKVGRDGAYDNSAVHYDVVGSSGNAGTHIFEVQGSEKLRIDSSGNVGINETSPETHLHVEQDNAHSSTYYTNADAAILLQNKNTGGDAKTVLKLEAPPSSSDCAIVYGGGTTNLIFSDRQNERLRITSAGKFGFNTINPPRDYCFMSGQADTNIQITNSTTGVDDSAGALIQQDGNDLYIWNKENSFMSLGTNATEKLRITSGGFIGINDTSPGRALSIKYNDNTAHSETAFGPELGAIRIFNQSTTTNATAGEIIFGAGDSGTGYATINAIRVGSQECELSFRVSDTATLNEALRLDKSANATFAGSVSDSIGPLRRLGSQGASSTFTLAADHAGKFVRMTGSGQTITVPQNIFTAGDMITIFNEGSGNTSIAQASGVTLYSAADGSTGTKTLAAKGLITILCTASNEFIMSGTQLS